MNRYLVKKMNLEGLEAWLNDRSGEGYALVEILPASGLMVWVVMENTSVS